MNAVGVTLIVGLVVLVLLIVSVVIVLVLADARRSRGVEVIQTGPTTLAIRTPYGKGHARIVVSEDHGRVYEVETILRGEGPMRSYVPPAAHLVRAHLAQRVDALDTTAPRRGLARRR